MGVQTRTLHEPPLPSIAGEPTRVDVLGVGISCVDIPQTVDIIAGWIGSGRHEYVCITGMHGIMESRRDPELRSIHNRSGLTTADGMPMVWATKWAGASWMSRVYGPDLMLAACEQAAQRGWSSYFVGGSEEVLQSLTGRLRARFPGLVVAGTFSPPFRPLRRGEDDDMVARINAAQPDIVWIGLGTPKQERWMADHRGALDAPVLVGVGAAFDMHAGVLKQAPPWMQRNGLEWLYRLKTEPRRLWRRYVLNIPRFIAALVVTPPHMVHDTSTD